MPVGRPPALTATAAARAGALLSSGLLTQAEVGLILGCSARTVRRRVAERRAEREPFEKLAEQLASDWTLLATWLATTAPERWGVARAGDDLDGVR